MARSPTTKTPKPANHSAATLKRAIERLQGTLRDMEDFDFSAITYANTGPIDALNANIARNIERAFGEHTSDAKRFAGLSVNRAFYYITIGSQPSDQQVRKNIADDLNGHIPMMREAIRMLEDDLAEMVEAEPTVVQEVATRAHTNKVFIVHGHDEAAKEQVARFLERLGIQAIILHEQANAGRTIIEKIEAFSDVDFAVVLLTPDDIGSQKDAQPVPRARQNVVLELGFFIGKLGRGQVAAFKKGEVEIPSDYLGVVWQPFDAGWQTALGRELQAGGFAVNWNLIMGTG